MFNINTVVFLIALICWLFQFSLPLSIEKPFRDLGHSTLVLSLVYIGYILSTIDIEKTFKKVSIYVLTVNKMIIAPLIVLFIIMQFRHYFPWLNKAAISAIILETGMPAMATIAILAKNYNSDFKLASENILVTTVLSIFTLPLLWFLINLIYK